MRKGSVVQTDRLGSWTARAGLTTRNSAHRITATGHYFPKIARRHRDAGQTAAGNRLASRRQTRAGTGTAVRRRTTQSPVMPMPSSASDIGSGTAVGS